MQLFRKTRDDGDRKTFVETRTNYNRVKRDKKQTFKRNKAKSLATNVHSSSVFWKELKGLRCEIKSKVNDKIDISEWGHHFQRVFSSKQNNSYEKNTLSLIHI
eukprot:TRINITY_DN39300_c0_g1_i2.p1 TRINITY_DN39300_c0_g1~~TRINITY_DN39300_c0_g1_i2.p1  ORF type:complete len:103 (+),score=14.67 TRINITY_DN39300_c0_g1_i2:72-380(+)